ncbi:MULTISPECIES: H-NS histone family protein [unclassified Bradyrhizobium]
MDFSAQRFERLSVDELLLIYDCVRSVLSKKIEQEKRKLEDRLTNLNAGLVAEPIEVRRDRQAVPPRIGERRKYPPVQPKYRNPADRSQTWAGRGKQPKWLVSQLKAGKKIEDFLIKRKTGTRGGHS